MNPIDRSAPTLPTRAALVLALALHVVGSAAPARANQVVWTNGAGGSAAVATNWLDAQTGTQHIPGPADAATFAYSGAFNVAWATPADTVWGLSVITGRPRFNITGALGSKNAIAVDADSLTLLSGTMRASRLLVGQSTPGTLLMTSKAQLTTTDSTTACWLGKGARARFTVQNGARYVNNSWVEMGYGPADHCTTTVIGRTPPPFVYAGLSTLSTAGGGYRGDVVVGLSGTALLQFENGGFADIAGNLFIGKASTGSGMVHLYNSPITAAGFPSLTVHGQTVIGAPDAQPQLGQGQLFIEKGSASLNGPCQIYNGSLVVRNGAGLTAGSVSIIPTPNDLASGILVKGVGSQAIINSSFQVGSVVGQALTINANAIADSGATLAYNGSSDLIVYANGNLSVGVGALASSAAPVRIRGFVHLNGTLQAPIVHLEYIGTVWSELETVFDATINARVLLDPLTSFHVWWPGSQVTAGDATATDGFSSSGYTHVESSTLTLLDRDGAELGSVSLTDATLRVPSGGRVQSGMELSGFGRYEGALINEGTIFVNSLDVLTIAGHLTQLTGLATGAGTISIPAGSALTAHGSIDPLIQLDGTLDFGPGPSLLSAGHGFQAAGTAVSRFRLGPKAAGIQDAMFVSGTAALDGTLDLRWVPGNPPVTGDTLTIITATSRTGTFSSVTFNGYPTGGHVSVIYGPTTVRVAILNAVTAVTPGDREPVPTLALRFASAGTLRAPVVALDLPASAEVNVALYDVSGRQVAVLAQGSLPAGRHELAVAAREVASGVYFGRAVVTDPSGTRALTTRVVLTR